jgi:hypothetical protein
MPFPSVPNLIYTDSVRVRVVTWETKDRAGGRVPTYGSWSGDTYRCSVSASGVTEAPTSTAQSIVTHIVTADSRLAGLRDQLQWQETDGILTIIGIEPAGDGNSRLWNHYCQEFVSD